MSVPFEDEERMVRVAAGAVLLEGVLRTPKDAAGLVLLAPGSDELAETRRRAVAVVLHRRGLATLVVDLWTAEERALDRAASELRVHISTMAERLVEVGRWLRELPVTGHLPLGYFGWGSGGAAVLLAAAQAPGIARAVVCRGARADLARDVLSKVEAPVLLIAAGLDPTETSREAEALQRLRAEKSLRVVPGATAEFGEPGALEEVGRLAAEWFLDHFSRGGAAAPVALNRIRTT
jgi:putative phosphoribosyl transferase